MSWWVILQGQSGISQFIGGFLNPSQPVTQRATKAVVVQASNKPANYYKGPFSTQSAAQTQANAYNNPNLGNELEETGNVGASSGSGQAFSWQAFFQGNIWLRVGEVVFGLILVAVGLAKMTNAVPIATKVAKAVA